LAAHQAQLAIIFLWSAIPLVQIAWQGDFEKWVSNPRVPPRYKLDKPSTNRMGVGQIITSVKNRGRFSAFGAQIVSTTGLYEWYYTIGRRTSSQCLVAASFLALLSGLFMAAGVIQHPRTDRDWFNLLHQLAHPAGLKPFVTLEWGLYSTNGDQWNHVFGLADASVGRSIGTSVACIGIWRYPWRRWALG
jgi:photosystem I P700 chlorophyll a apoprotein A2